MKTYGGSKEEFDNNSSSLPLRKQAPPPAGLALMGRAFSQLASQDITLVIFSALSLKDIAQAMLVSQSWYSISTRSLMQRDDSLAHSIQKELMTSWLLFPGRRPPLKESIFKNALQFPSTDIWHKLHCIKMLFLAGQTYAGFIDDSKKLISDLAVQLREANNEIREGIIEDLKQAAHGLPDNIKIIAINIIIKEGFKLAYTNNLSNRLLGASSSALGLLIPSLSSKGSREAMTSHFVKKLEGSGEDTQNFACATLEKINSRKPLGGTEKLALNSALERISLKRVGNLTEQLSDRYLSEAQYTELANALSNLPDSANEKKARAIYALMGRMPYICLESDFETDDDSTNFNIEEHSEIDDEATTLTLFSALEKIAANAPDDSTKIKIIDGVIKMYGAEGFREASITLTDSFCSILATAILNLSNKKEKKNQINELISIGYDYCSNGATMVNCYSDFCSALAIIIKNSPDTEIKQYTTNTVIKKLGAEEAYMRHFKELKKTAHTIPDNQKQERTIEALKPENCYALKFMRENERLTPAHYENERIAIETKINGLLDEMRCGDPGPKDYAYTKLLYIIKKHPTIVPKPKLISALVSEQVDQLTSACNSKHCIYFDLEPVLFKHATEEEKTKITDSYINMLYKNYKHPDHNPLTLCMATKAVLPYLSNYNQKENVAKLTAHIITSWADGEESPDDINLCLYDYFQLLARTIKELPEGAVKADMLDKYIAKLTTQDKTCVKYGLTALTSLTESLSDKQMTAINNIPRSTCQHVINIIRRVSVFKENHSASSSSEEREQNPPTKLVKV